MGYENRDYHRDGWDTGSGSNWKPTSTAGRSMITTLIMINVAIFVLDMFSGVYQKGQQPVAKPGVVYVDENGNEVKPDPKKKKDEINNLMRFLALETDVYKKPWKIWQLLTHGFAHSSVNSESSFFHIGSNMLVLFFLGRPLEMRLGAMEFLKFYLIAILVSGIGYVALSIGGRPGIAVGASGAVSAVVALFIFLYPKQTLLLFGIIPMPAWVLGVFIVLTDVFRAFDGTSNIAWQSHLTGFAFGVAYFYRSWNFGWLQLEKIPDLFKSRPKLKVHRETSLDKIKKQADEILEKINEQGEASLTAGERKILQKYSKQVRNQRD